MAQVKVPESGKQSGVNALHVLVEASSKLLSTPKLEEVLPKILALANDIMAADGYALWRRSPSGDKWEILHDMGLSLSYRSESSVSGATAQRLLNEPFISEDVSKTFLIAERQSLYRKEGIKALIAYPLTADGVTGTMTLYFKSIQKFDAERVMLGAALTNLAAAAIRTAELYERELHGRLKAEADKVRSDFLAKATAALGSSLDYSITLTSVANLAIPSIADWCSVFVLKPDGTLERSAVAHAEKQKVDLATRMQKLYPPDLKKGTGLSQVVATGLSQFVPAISEEMLHQGARDENHFRMMKQLQMKSIMMVPLKFANRVLGVLTLVTAESGREFAKEDLELAETLADRAAIAVENARLYQTARQETTLREQAESWKQLAQEAANVIAWELNLDTEQFRVGPELFELLGIPRTEMFTYSDLIKRLFFSEDRARATEALKRARRKKGDFETTFRISKGKDEVRWISCRGKMFYNSGSAIMLGVMIDVTDAKGIAAKSAS